MSSLALYIGFDTLTSPRTTTAPGTSLDASRTPSVDTQLQQLNITAITITALMGSFISLHFSSLFDHVLHPQRDQQGISHMAEQARPVSGAASLVGTEVRVRVVIASSRIDTN